MRCATTRDKHPAVERCAVQYPGLRLDSRTCTFDDHRGSRDAGDLGLWRRGGTQVIMQLSEGGF